MIDFLINQGYRIYEKPSNFFITNAISKDYEEVWGLEVFLVKDKYIAVKNVKNPS